MPASHLASRQALQVGRPEPLKTVGEPTPLYKINTKEREEMPIKDMKMSIRISKKDLEKIKKKAGSSGKSLTDYVTEVCLGKKIIRIEGLEDVVRQQKAMGNNLNQLTRLCHEGRISVVHLQETLQEFQKINEKISDLIERKEG